MSDFDRVEEARERNEGLYYEEYHERHVALKRYTVLGVYSDSTDPDAPQRYASYFWAEDPSHAEEQAMDEAGETLVIAAVVRGQVEVVS